MMANGMRGSALPATPDGWLGRVLDGLAVSDPNPLLGVNIGWRTPLHLIGSTTRASTIPEWVPWDQLGLDYGDAGEARMQQALTDIAAQSTSLGNWGDRIARTYGQAISIAPTVNPFYPGDDVQDLERSLTLCANLINADLGVRILDVSLSGFDTHSGQAFGHPARLDEIDR